MAMLCWFAWISRCGAVHSSSMQFWHDSLSPLFLKIGHIIYLLSSHVTFAKIHIFILGLHSSFPKFCLPFLYTSHWFSHSRSLFLWLLVVMQTSNMDNITVRSSVLYIKDTSSVLKLCASIIHFACILFPLSVWKFVGFGNITIFF